MSCSLILRGFLPSFCLITTIGILEHKIHQIKLHMKSRNQLISLTLGPNSQMGFTILPLESQIV
ncbi:hypothetical protein HanIR_Chr05g0248001 [Helianthus annuus]|nr:hypothetical protein HanIR_Chr05g0248001 [Helianthus annuus]